MERKEFEKVLDEYTNVDMTVSLSDGVEVAQDPESGDFIGRVNGNDVTYTRDDVVRIQYNKNTFDRIRKYLDILINSRGIKNVDEIDASDTDVRAYLRKRQAKINKSQGQVKRKLNNNDTAAAIEHVKSVHRPFYQTSLFQLIYWGLLYDDLFRVGKNMVDCRLEVDVPEGYWNIDERFDMDDNLDRLLSGHTVAHPVLDETHPLEVMIAITTTLVNNYPKLADRMSEAVRYATLDLTFRGLGEERFDDASFLRSQLDDALHSIVGIEDEGGYGEGNAE